MTQTQNEVSFPLCVCVSIRDVMIHNLSVSIYYHFCITIQRMIELYEIDVVVVLLWLPVLQLFSAYIKL